jgi:PAS domain S-box-containing protein
MRPRRLTPRPFGALADRIESFAQIVRDSGERVSSLSHDSEAPGRLADALELLHQQALELSAADEELRAQVEALTYAAERSQREFAHYKTLFDLAPLAYLVTDLSGVIQESNARATELFAARARVLAGKPLVALMTRESIPAVLQAIAKANRGDSTHVRVRLRGHRGEKGPLASLNVDPARDADRLLCAFSEPHLPRMHDA